MYWLLLPAAAFALVLALRTPSPGLMLFWFVLMLVALAAWAWLRYRQLFPKRAGGVALTPLDPGELTRLRQQMQANRAAEAAAQAVADAEALHPIHPIAHGLSPAASAPLPAAPARTEIERPLTGRAVFVVPDQPSSVIIPSERLR